MHAILQSNAVFDRCPGVPCDALTSLNYSIGGRFTLSIFVQCLQIHELRNIIET